MGSLALTYCCASVHVLSLISLPSAAGGIIALSASGPGLYFILSAAGLFLLILFFILGRRYKLLLEKLRIAENKLRKTLDLKSDLELKNKNLTDSLIYAQRIQEALLPSEAYFRSHFSDSFIFFKPKDIVSGDFYWIGEKNDRIFIVAADCTGHGVPGALMSMIGIEIIGKAINEKHIEEPSQILSVLNKALETTFRSEKNIGTIIRDGMDIGLCRIDKADRKMVYAGSFFPLYLIRDNSLSEIKGDKLIIGLNPENAPYTDHEINIFDGDIFYIFSDGFVDQFGGEENKKYMYRRFRYLLTRIHQFSVEDQKSILEEEFRAWIGSNVQVDDITVIGFRPFPD